MAIHRRRFESFSKRGNTERCPLLQLQLIIFLHGIFFLSLQMRSRVLVFECSFKWHTILFLMLFCSNSAQFLKIQLVYDRRTDWRVDGQTDGRTHPLTEMRERISKQVPRGYIRCDCSIVTCCIIVYDVIDNFITSKSAIFVVRK